MNALDPISQYRGLPPTTDARFLTAVKELLEGLIGQRGNLLDRAATLRDMLNPKIVNFLNQQAVSVTQNGITTVSDLSVPPPPDGLVLVKDVDAGRIAAFSHQLTWDVPSSTNIYYTELWVAETPDRDAAVLEGIITYPQHVYTRMFVNPTKNYWYWIRSMSREGVASTWYPVDSVNGTLVDGDDTIQDTINRVMDVLKGESPADYNGASLYYVGDQVKYLGTDGGTRAYVVIDDDGGAGITGVDPTDTDHWSRNGILVVGNVDGEASVGIDGNLVVDGTILARQLSADSVTADKIAANQITADKMNVSSLSSVVANLGTITAGIAKSSDGRLIVDFDNKWIRVYDADDVLRVELGYIP